MATAVIPFPRIERVTMFQAPTPKTKKFLEEQKQFEADIEKALSEIRAFQNVNVKYYGEGVYKIGGARPEDTRMIYPGEWIVFGDEQSISHFRIYNEQMLLDNHVQFDK